MKDGTGGEEARDDARIAARSLRDAEDTDAVTWRHRFADLSAKVLAVEDPADLHGLLYEVERLGEAWRADLSKREVFAPLAALVAS